MLLTDLRRDADQLVEREFPIDECAGGGEDGGGGGEEEEDGGEEEEESGIEGQRMDTP